MACLAASERKCEIADRMVYRDEYYANTVPPLLGEKVPYRRVGIGHRTAGASCTVLCYSVCWYSASYLVVCPANFLPILLVRPRVLTLREAIDDDD
jgi:hypothetical protein